MGTAVARRGVNACRADFFAVYSGDVGALQHRPRAQLQVDGSYLLPWDIQLGGNFRAQSGQPYTRTLLVTGLNQNTAGVTVNAEPRGKYLLPSVKTDLRLGKIFRFGTNEFEADMDVYNVTNSNAVFNVRNGTGLQTVTDFTNNTSVRIAQFGSPIGVLGPRIVRFNVSYKFGRS